MENQNEEIINQPLEEVDLSDEVTETPEENLGESLMNLEATINRYIGDSEKLREQMKSQKEMYNATFENDAPFAELTQKEKELRRQKMTIKQKLQKEPAVVLATNKINEIKEELKDIQDMLTGLLEQYQEMSGSNQFTTESGEIREIIKILRVVRKK
jgi:hypothetical protein